MSSFVIIKCNFCNHFCAAFTTRIWRFVMLPGLVDVEKRCRSPKFPTFCLWKPECRGVTDLRLVPKKNNFFMPSLIVHYLSIIVCIIIITRWSSRWSSFKIRIAGKFVASFHSSQFDSKFDGKTIFPAISQVLWSQSHHHHCDHHHHHCHHNHHLISSSLSPWSSSTW